MTSAETDRIRAAYAARPSGLWSARNPYVMWTRHQIERATIDALNATGVDLPRVRVLDIGTGSGVWANILVQLGAEPTLVEGIDLNEQRIDLARQAFPRLSFRVGDAADLPYDDGTFGLVTQFTALSNIKDPDVLARAASELQRVLMPGGIMLWFDIAGGAETPVYRPVQPDSVRELLGRCNVVRQRWLLHRWAALVAPRAPLLCSLVEALPVPKLNVLMAARRR